MNFWSEGLGDRELVMGLDRAKLDRKGEHIVLTGIVDAPAPWEYEVKIHYQDWTTILRTATSKEACGFIASAVGVGTIASMAVSIVKFVVLLGYFRLTRLLGLSREHLAPGDMTSNAASKG